MSKFLQDIQYRVRKASFSNWQAGQDYEDWKDITTESEFLSGTQFRLKPVFEYVVNDSINTFRIATENEALNRVVIGITRGKQVTVSRVEKTHTGGDITQVLFSRNVQFKLGLENKWTGITYFNASSCDRDIKFRIRPDHYYEVVTFNDLISGLQTFDDVEAVAKYVDSRIRTSGEDFTLRKKKYV